VIRATFANRGLRRMTLGYLAFSATEYAVWIAMLVYAYEQGGATAAGVVALVQLVPATLFAPIGGVLSDRRRPAAVLAWGYVTQCAALSATAAVLLGGGPPVLAYFFATLVTTLITITRPAQAVLGPSLARTPEELTGFNVLIGWIESAAVLVGPALTGVILAFGSPGLVFAFCAGLALWATLLVLPLVGRRPRPAAEEPISAGAFEEVAAGVRAVALHPGVRLLVLFLVAQNVVLGAFDVIAVVLALDVLDLGQSGAGYLNAAMGAGCMLGAAVTMTLIGRRHLVPPLLLGALGMGAGFVLLAAYPTVAGAFVLLAVAGAGSMVVEVAGRTLLQRLAPPELLARVFGLYESLTQAAIGLGAILVPVLVAVGGAEAALVAAGVLLPLLIALRFRALRAIDEQATVPIVEISLLRSMPIFALLPAPELEGLARSLTAVDAERGTVIIRQGDPGDRFYAIADGEVEISFDGVPTATRGRGDCLGEIALLLDVPRTRTVTAATDVRLYALEREPFLTTVTGHAATSQAADEIVKERVA
jgi:MFS family permease